ncbi:hypothetical protein BsWGS_08142 [Bradybaena similaris]
MPTTTNTKVELKPSTDLGDAARQCLNCLEKKVRNLEKRKGRIEINQEKARKGTKLEKEQENSLQQYEQVTHDLEFARELHKQFGQIIQEHEKMMKKQAKREKAERQALEIKRISEILQLQTLLDSMGGDKVREDFKTGKHGAVVLTEDNLTQLDELYQAISPSRDDSGDEYPQRLTLAAEHLVNILDGKDRQVVGTTYKEIKELITLINECGYFERARKAETEEVVAETPQDTEQFEDTTEEPVDEEEISTEEQDLNGEQQPIDLTIATSDGSRTNQDLTTNSLNTLEQDAFFAPSNQEYEAEIEPQYSQPTHTAAPRIPDFQSFTNNRPFQFIQASYVMPESTAPGIVDPAVLVAQPAVSSGLQFMSQGFDPVPQGTLQQPAQQPSQSISVGGVTDLTQQTQSSVAQQSHPPQITSEYASPTYSQPVLQQNILQPEGLFSVQAITEVPNTAHTGIMGQIRDDVSSYEIPPSIPMPPSQQEQTLEQQQQQVQEKKFQMNASAPVFQSMYAQASTPANQIQPPSLAPLTDSQAADFSGTPTPSGDYGQANTGDFQQSYHTNNGFSSGPYPRGGRGGFRGGRGGNGGNGGNRNVNPAGSPLQNGFNGRGGGSPNTNNSRGARGGTYQGYPPNNYRPDGFQGNFNASTLPGAVYQKRGGLNNASNPASTAGYARGGTAGNGSRGAGIRGGVARGGAGSGPRGAPRGGYNRPMPA